MWFKDFIKSTKLKLFIVIIVVVLILFFFTQSQNLNGMLLEYKAKEYFYGLGEKEVAGVTLKASDFVLDKNKSGSMNSNKLTSFDSHCRMILEGKCFMTEKELKALNEPIHFYYFKIKEGVLPDTRAADGIIRAPYGRVILKDNGEPIAYYYIVIEYQVRGIPPVIS